MASNTTDTVGAIGYINRSNLDEKTPAIVVDSLWNSSIGRVVGPVYKDGKYSIYQKVAEAKDSFPMVNVSHILIPLSGELPNGTIIADSTQALAIAQNVYNQVAGGKTIAELASTYSTDKSSAVNGGSYGWADPRQYVESYKKFCLEAKKNQLGLVKTEYGYHIMRMMEEPDYRKIKYQVDETEVTPGQKTVKLVDEKSRKFKNLVNPDKPETFEKAVEKLGMIPRIGNNFTFDQKSVGGIDNYSDVRTLIYWLFDDKRENNEISEVFAFTNKHVIVKLENIKHIGYATVDNVRSEIEGTVKEQLKCKKAAEKLENALKTAKTADALAKAVNGDLIDLNVVRYGQGFLPQIGQEFGILGAIYGMGETKVSKPILGKQVAAVIFMNKNTKMDIPVSIYNAPQEDSYTNQPQFVLNRLQEVLTRTAAIQDFRYKFEWYK
jgi:peptidyl-prolyl cis-trans isomerase D